MNHVLDNADPGKIDRAVLPERQAASLAIILKLCKYLMDLRRLSSQKIGSAKTGVPHLTTPTRGAKVELSRRDVTSRKLEKVFYLCQQSMIYTARRMPHRPRRP